MSQMASLSLSQVSVGTVEPSQMSQPPSPHHNNNPFEDEEDGEVGHDDGSPEITVAVTAEDQDNDEDDDSINDNLPLSQFAAISGSQVLATSSDGLSQSPQRNQHATQDSVAENTEICPSPPASPHSPINNSVPQTFADAFGHIHNDIVAAEQRRMASEADEAEDVTDNEIDCVANQPHTYCTLT